MAARRPDSRPRPTAAGAWGKSTLRHLLTETDRFVTVAEIVTSRGPIADESGRRMLSLARALAENQRIDALSLTDNPAGGAWLSSDTVGTDLLSRGQEVIIHLACKDWNRNALQSRGWKLSSEGFDNILALSGDYPTQGYQGAAAPVFDIDSVGLLRMYSHMNDGLLQQPGAGLQTRTRFFLGAVVTNHKRHEREVMPQYFKLRKKVENGAAFIINQIGYHARKDDELLRWMAAAGLDVPVIGNVYVLSPRAARVFHAGRVPGVVVTDELLALAERHASSPDRGRSFFFDLAAKQVAIAAGLGFRGAYLGGRLEPDDYDEILDRAAAFAPDDWRAFVREVAFPFPDEFHFYEVDDSTGLSSDEIKREYVASKERARPRHAPLSYRFSRLVHGAVFDPDGAAHGPARATYRAADRRPPGVRRALHVLEQTVKVPMFHCRDCGDCSLPEIAYLCPESQCVKNQRNGPCGGTRQGTCEIGEKECIWARAYDRLKAYGEEETMLDYPAVVKDNALHGTSAWANALLERDHRGRVEGAARPEPPRDAA